MYQVDERSRRSKLKRLKLFVAARKNAIGSAQHVADRAIRTVALTVVTGVAGTNGRIHLHHKNMIIKILIFRGGQFDIALS